LIETLNGILTHLVTPLTAIHFETAAVDSEFITAR